MSAPVRTQSPLTDNERSMIINLHEYFLSPQKWIEQKKNVTLRKQVAMALGIGEATVGRVLCDWNHRNDGKFTPHKIMGRPTVEPSADIAEVIRNLIRTANLTGTPLATPILCQKLGEHGYTLSKKQLLHVLHLLGYYYGRGERRNILHETPANVAFRGRYICKRLENLQGKNYVPTKPEVFLDESYCHLHHNRNNTWLPHQGVVLTQGHGPLVVIFGAIIVLRNGNTNRLIGEIVPNSLLIWDPSIKPPSGRGRKRTNADSWGELPDAIRRANIVADNIDYHGNFTAEIFEDLFERLCQTVLEWYGTAYIHMDGARYHKRRVEQVPTSSARKSVLADWLMKKNIPIPERANKAELYELVKYNKSEVPFACIEIARKYGHTLLYMPPYHCELQPIEGVWAVAKNEVAKSAPHSDLLSIRNKLLYSFNEKINSKTILGLWRRSLNIAKKYNDIDDDIEFAEIDSDDDELQNFNENDDF